MEAPSDAVRRLLAAKSKRERGTDGDAMQQLPFEYRPVETEKKKQRPEDAVPDYPQHKRVREHLKRSEKMGGACALSDNAPTTSQCWRCKLYGHATGSKECPYFKTGNIESEAERRVREDPLVAVGSRAAVLKEEKLKELNELLAAVKQEEREKKKEKKKKKKKKEKEKKKKERNNAEDSSSQDKKKKKKKKKNKEEEE
jgi:retinitis pigmentosa 9 protein